MGGCFCKFLYQLFGSSTLVSVEFYKKIELQTLTAMQGSVTRRNKKYACFSMYMFPTNLLDMMVQNLYLLHTQMISDARYQSLRFKQS